MKIKTKSLASIGVIGLLLVINACAQTPMKGEYYVGFMNKTGHLLDAVSVYYGGTQAAAVGGMVKCGMATDGPLTLPIPSEVEVRWIDASEPHVVKVKIGGVLLKRLTDDWTLYFIISSNATVQAKAVRIDDRAAMKELEKGLIPEGEYRIGFVNKTGHDVEAISVSAGITKLLEHPKLIGGASTFSGYLDPPIAPETELQWKQDGTPHAVKVKLADVPKGFEGIIYFVAEADGSVEVHPVKNGDDKGAAKLVK
jgi:hypothetical protein